MDKAKVGQVWQSKDSRDGGKRVQVLEVADGKAKVQALGVPRRPTSVSLDANGGLNRYVLVK